MKSQLQKLEDERNKLQEKCKSQNKKNQNLLKMNNSLMNQNQTYLNCLLNLKKWSTLKFQLSSQIDDSVDAQNADQFVQTLITHIQESLKVKQQCRLNSQFSEVVSKNQTNQNCEKCQRWKTLYMKEIQQNNRLNSYISQLQGLSQVKKINFEKLTFDIQNLLADYLVLFKNKWNPISQNHNIQEQLEKKQKKTDRSKDKLSNSKHKSFSKDKDSKEKHKQKILPTIKRQNDQIKDFKKMAEKLRQYNTSSEKQISVMRIQILQLQQILSLYRQRQRNRILYGHQ